MELRISSFCSLSRNLDWHSFLQRVAPDIYSNLTEFLKTNTGCRSAKDKMIGIYRELYSRKLGNEFEDFIRRRFPYIIESDDETPKKPAKSRQKAIPPSAMNKHGVFKNYKPGILSFPHKLIMIDGDSEQLIKKVKEFLSDKIAIDYIIIGDTAYVEYLMRRYEDIVHQIPHSAKEIDQFRKKMSQK